MSRDYEDIFNVDDLSDAELRDLVQERLQRHDGVDADSILVTVSDGLVRLSGRVGTDGERRIADHLLSDVIGLTRYENEIVVDEIRRDEAPEAADDEAAEYAEGSGEPLGEPRRHPDNPSEEDEVELDARLYGTHDVGSAIQEGTSWVPPEAPTQEGFSGTVGDEDIEDQGPASRR